MEEKSTMRSKLAAHTQSQPGLKVLTELPEKRNIHLVHETSQARAIRFKLKMLAHKKNKKHFFSENWRAPLLELEKQILYNDPKAISHVEIPNGYHESLTRADPGPLEARRQCGCLTQQPEREHTINRGRWHVLTDSPAREENLSKIMLRVSSAPISAFKISEKPSSIEPNLHSRFSEDINKIPMRADHIPEPTHWCPTTFLDYITRLSRSEMPSQLHSFYYSIGEDHTEIKTALIMRAFLGPNRSAYITLEAFHEALNFFIKHYKLGAMRHLFVEMEQEQLKMNTRSLNLMLKAPALAYDLHNFTFLLRLMMRHRGIHPDFDTWFLLIRANSTFKIRGTILRRMVALGLFKDLTLAHKIRLFKTFAPLILRAEISAWLDSKKEAVHFIQQIDICLKRSWLTLKAANTVLDELSKRGKINDAWAVIQLMATRTIQPNIHSFNAILRSCIRLGNNEGTIQLIQAMSSMSSIKPDATTYNLLWAMGWTSQLFNVVRVVWRYACMDGALSESMKMGMRKSFGAAASRPKLDNENVWLVHSGAVMAGIYRKPAQTAALAGEDPVVPLAGIIKQPPGRQKLRSPRWWLEDRRAFQDRRPMKPLASVLSLAWELDKRWAVENAKFRPLHWKISRAVRIHVDVVAGQKVPRKPAGGKNKRPRPRVNI
ncbi:MAG: hypothetical protein M1829_002315 [Trizodia sp. TS-e1964]|nr:MAG: hypothetical protein M1829_002315 [Trizodia sp. TS-e1964]